MGCLFPLFSFQAIAFFSARKEDVIKSTSFSLKRPSRMQKHSFFARHSKLDGGTTCEVATGVEPNHEIHCDKCCQVASKCNLGFWCGTIKLMNTWETKPKHKPQPKQSMHMRRNRDQSTSRIYCYAFSKFPPVVNLMEQLDSACDAWNIFSDQSDPPYVIKAYDKSDWEFHWQSYMEVPIQVRSPC
jgi:hypothetical protein